MCTFDVASINERVLCSASTQYRTLCFADWNATPVTIVNRKSVGIKLIREKLNFTHDRHGIQLRDAIVQGTVRKLRHEEPPSTVEVADRVILRMEYHVCFLPNLSEISIYLINILLLYLFSKKNSSRKLWSKSNVYCFFFFSLRNFL